MVVLERSTDESTQGDLFCPEKPGRDFVNSRIAFAKAKAKISIVLVEESYDEYQKRLVAVQQVYIREAIVKIRGTLHRVSQNHVPL